MKKIILTTVYIGVQTILLTTAQAGSLNPTVDKILLIQQAQDSTKQQSEDMSIKNKDYKYAGKAMLYSGMVPGLGEYYTGHWKRGLIFAGAEITSWIFWSKYSKKGDDAAKAFEKYADDHWSFSRWVADYYKWDDNGNPYKFLFSKDIGDTTNIYIYENLWEGSHSMDFYYTHYASGEEPQVKLMSTNTSEFEEYYHNNFEDKTVDEIKVLVGYTDSIGVYHAGTDPEFHVIQDGAYYENVGKYNGFFSGWDDNDSLSVYDETGYAVAKSPHKWTYRKMRRNSNDYKKIANYMISTIMLNHVASMIDAVITTKIWNDNLSADLSAHTKFDPNEKFGIGGVQFDLTLNW